MSSTGNLPNQNSVGIDPTQKFFNNFYEPPQGVSAMVNDSVVGYFQEITGDAETGRNLASAVIYTSLQQNLDPMEIISQLKNLSIKNKALAPVQYHGTTDQYAQDTDVYNSQTGQWTASGQNHARPGPSTSYNQISEVDAYLTMFLNLNRVGTSLLGLNNSPQTSPYVERAILP